LYILMKSPLTCQVRGWLSLIVAEMNLKKEKSSRITCATFGKIIGGRLFYALKARLSYNNNMIGIMSDSHDNLVAINKAIDIFNRADCSLVIHAGDIIAPFAAQELRKLKCPVKAVFGNCDGEKDGLIKVFKDLGEIKPAPFSFIEDNRRFIVSHYPLEDVQEEADIIVFGHTHRSQVSQQGELLVINPGETGGWVKGVCTVVLLEAEKMSADIIIL